MERASPTRTELLSLRGRVRLASQGARLLRGKREALVREFLAGLKEYAGLREGMRRSLAQALQSLMHSFSVDGPEAVASVGLASRITVNVDIEELNIRGTKVAEVKSYYRARRAGGHRYTALGASARIEDTTERFEETLELILEIAPLDRKLRRLAEDIRKTTRRVNALEQQLIPSLEEQIGYIRGVLDQREREDIFRLKRLKKSRTP